MHRRVDLVQHVQHNVANVPRMHLAKGEMAARCKQSYLSRMSTHSHKPLAQMNCLMQCKTLCSHGVLNSTTVHIQRHPVNVFSSPAGHQQHTHTCLTTDMSNASRATARLVRVAVTRQMQCSCTAKDSNRTCSLLPTACGRLEPPRALVSQNFSRAEAATLPASPRFVKRRD